MSKSNGNAITKLTRTVIAPIDDLIEEEKPGKVVVTKQQIDTMKAIYTQQQEMMTELYMLQRVLADDYDPRMPKDKHGDVDWACHQAEDFLDIAYKMVEQAQERIAGWLKNKGKMGEKDFVKIDEAVGERYGEYI